MKFEPTGIADLCQVMVKRHVDERGSFGRSFCRDTFVAHGLAAEFVQTSSSRTHRAGTIRGMHLQLPPHAEAKLVRCVRGTIHDVVCDLRTDSVTYLHHKAFRLSQDSDSQIYIPPGCAHGFQTLTDDVEVLYSMSCRFAPQSATGVRFDDVALDIAWPIPVTTVAEKDLSWPAYRIT